MPKQGREAGDGAAAARAAKKHKKSAKAAKNLFREVVVELDMLRAVLQRALLRLLNLAWPGAINTSMVDRPPRITAVTQRLTEGLNPQEFCEQIMNVLFGFFWEVCKAMEDTNTVLFKKVKDLQIFAQNIKHADVESVKDKVADIRFCRTLLYNFNNKDLGSKLRLNELQQKLLDIAMQDEDEDFEFGPFAQKCIDLALKKDPRMFQSVESSRMFFEALQVAAMGSKLSDLRTKLDTCHEKTGDLLTKYESC